ncbi:Sortilin, partial [Egretta garzetta]
SGGSRGGRIFRSSDFAKHFVQTDLPFHPLVQITYHPQNSDYLLALSTENGLWVSRDFGEKWEEIHKAVCLAKWGANDTIFFTTYLNNSCKADLGLLELKKTSDFGKAFKVIGTKIYSFGLGGRFLFASVMTEKGNTRRIHVSLDQGETWNMAQLPSVGHEQFYSILAANDDLVFMHVDEPGDTGFGTIYTSDDRGIVYSKSLERHLYTTTGGETDFTNVTSLRGIYITSVLSEDNSIQSVITFDRGGEWVPLRKPKNTTCDSTARSKEECSLHIHASYSISQKLNVPMAPLSEPNAVGIVIAHGTEPQRGGWRGQRDRVGARPMNVSVWGFRENFHSRKWVSYTIDFSELLSRTCEDKDYTIWLAHSSNPSDPSDGCILGYKEQYRRLRKSSVCQNGRDYMVTKQPSVCPCTLEDFLCDFGYYRPENQSVCVEQPELKGHDLEFCLYGRRELLKTSGYRKIPGDKCLGGESPSRKETDMKKKCTSNFLNPSQLVASTSSTPIILAVVAVLLVTAVAGVLLIKKYVCGGR